MYGTKVYIKPEDILNKLSEQEREKFNKCIFTEIEKDTNGCVEISCLLFNDDEIIDWNYDMESCPLDTKVCLLSEDGNLLLPQQDFVGTITHNGRFRTRGECYAGDPDYFYRSAIVAWKPLQRKR